MSTNGIKYLIRRVVIVIAIVNSSEAKQSKSVEFLLSLAGSWASLKPNKLGTLIAASVKMIMGTTRLIVLLF